VQSLSVSGVLDCKDNFSWHEGALEKMVLDDFLDGSAQEWGVDAVIAEDAQDQELQDSVAYVPQDTQGDGARDAPYKLAGLVEMDDSYFGGSKPGKEGRGALDKAKVIVSVEDRGRNFIRPEYSPRTPVCRTDHR